MKNTQSIEIPQCPQQHHPSSNESTLPKLSKSRLRQCSAYVCACCHGLRDFLGLFCRGLRDYCKRGCLVGTRYLAEPNYHITERIFWIIIIMSSSLSGYYVIKRYLISYERDVFQLIIEDRPLTNDVDFPAVGLCEFNTGYSKKIQQFRNDIYQEYSALNNSHIFGRFISGFSFQSMVDKDTFTNFYKIVEESPELDTEYYNNLDYAAITEKIHANCTEFFHKCFWNETAFECCNYFRPVNTMIGKCFLLNSLQTENGTFLNMRVSGYMERSSVKIIFTKQAQIFLLNWDDIPEGATPFPKFMMGSVAQAGYMEFNLVPMLNDPEIAALTTKVKKCFSNITPQADMPGNMSLTYPYLSYTSCLNECVRHAQLQKCGCIQWHLNKGKNAAEAPYCDLRGYVCLELHKLIYITSMQQLPLPACGNCLPSCNEAGIIFVNFDYINEYSALGENRSVTISMLSFPQRHTRRQLVRGHLDIVVSLGGILSLFMGCNLLNIIEFIFIVARVVVRGRRTN